MQDTYDAMGSLKGLIPSSDCLLFVFNFWFVILNFDQWFKSHWALWSLVINCLVLLWSLCDSVESCQVPTCRGFPFQELAKERNPTTWWQEPEILKDSDPCNQKQPPWKKTNCPIKLHFSLTFHRKNTLTSWTPTHSNQWPA